MGEKTDFGLKLPDAIIRINHLESLLLQRDVELNDAKARIKELENTVQTLMAKDFHKDKPHSSMCS